MRRRRGRTCLEARIALSMFLSETMLETLHATLVHFRSMALSQTKDDAHPSAACTWMN